MNRTFKALAATVIASVMFFGANAQKVKTYSVSPSGNDLVVEATLNGLGKASSVTVSASASLTLNVTCFNSGGQPVANKAVNTLASTGASTVPARNGIASVSLTLDGDQYIGTDATPYCKSGWRGEVTSITWMQPVTLTANTKSFSLVW